MILKKCRKAIAMIELIFSLVIMGIVMLSAPMLMNTATSSSILVTQQEAIAQISSDINMMLTYPWSEENTNEEPLHPIVNVNGDANLTSIGNSRRAGTPNTSRRSFLTSLLGTRTPNVLGGVAILGPDVSDLDDIDDFIGVRANPLQNIGAASMATGDVVDTNVTLTTTVGYIDDVPDVGTYIGDGGATLRYNNPFNKAIPATSSNIKWIQITLGTANADNAMNKAISMSAFSCNIGNYELSRRSFP